MVLVKSFLTWALNDCFKHLCTNLNEGYKGIRHQIQSFLNKFQAFNEQLYLKISSTTYGFRDFPFHLQTPLNGCS